MWQSLFPCTPRQVQLSSSFLSTCNWRSPKSDSAVPVTLTKKRRKVSKTWWSEWTIGWHKLEQEAGGNTSFTALMRRLLFMSHRLLGGNRLSPRQLGLISNSPRQWLDIFVLSSSFIWKWPLGWPSRIALSGDEFDKVLRENKGGLFYQVLSFENDPWAGLRRILAVACATTNKHWCVQRPVSVGRLSHSFTLNLPSLVPGYTTALYNLKMANDGVEPGTSTTAFMRTFPMPTPHVNCQLSSVILRVFSIGESWLLLAQPRTNTDVYKGLFPWEGFRTLLHWIYQASFQDTLQHSTTLKWLTMVSNLAHPQLLSCEHSQCPHPMSTASFLVSSYVSFQLSAGEIGLDQLHWTWYVAEPIPLHTKTSPVEQQFPVHLQLKESKVRLSCSRDFD